MRALLIGRLVGGRGVEPPEFPPQIPEGQSIRRVVGGHPDLQGHDVQDGPDVLLGHDLDLHAPGRPLCGGHGKINGGQQQEADEKGEADLDQGESFIPGYMLGIHSGGHMKDSWRPTTTESVIPVLLPGQVIRTTTLQELGGVGAKSVVVVLTL
jgi:hypothetical protein